MSENNEVEATTLSLAYHITKDRFLIKRAGRWDTKETLNEKGAVNHLVQTGWAWTDAHSFIKKCEYKKIYGIEMKPGKPECYKKADGFPYLNAWLPPTLSPQEGEWPRIRQVFEFLVAGDQEGLTWFYHWLARKVQNPLLLPKLAVVFSTRQGAGKNFIYRVIAEMLGMDNCEIIYRKNLENKFNARWIEKLFVLADEVVASDNVKDISDDLKYLIDGNESEQEGKGSNQRMVPNYLAWIFASNDPVSPVRLEESDRRYTVFSNFSPVTAEYKETLEGCFEGDGKTLTESFKAEIQGFWYYLLNLAADEQLVRKPYKNEARQKLIEATLPMHTLFFRYVEEQGMDDLLSEISRSDPKFMNNTSGQWDFRDCKERPGVSTEAVYRCYTEFAKRSGGKALRDNKFGQAVRNQVRPWPKTRRTVEAGKGKKQVYCYAVPLRQPDGSVSSPDASTET